MTKILIVDDSNSLVDVLTAMLRRKLYNVASVSSRQEALDKISSFTPQIVLLDVRLNGTDGREICNFIKSDTSIQLKTILMSASPDLLANYQACGADDVLEKPFDLDIILQKLTNVISTKKQLISC
jgi:CheY-like chemotaxis protein